MWTHAEESDRDLAREILHQTVRVSNLYITVELRGQNVVSCQSAFVRRQIC